MSKNLIILTVTFTLFFQVRCFAQENVISYPTRFGHYYTVPLLQHPAWAGSDGIYNISAGDKRLSGNYSNISTYYLSFHTPVRLKKTETDKPFSAIGFNLVNDREGKYINRTRAYLVYAWHATLFSDVWFSGGIQLGLVDYNVKGTPLSGDGNDIAPDGSVGFSLYTDKWHFLASYCQLMNSTIQPLEESAKLNSYFNLTGDMYFYTSTLISLKIAANAFIPLSDKYSPAYYDVTFLSYIKERFGINTGLHNTKRIFHSFAIYNAFNTAHSIDIELGYSYPIQKSDVRNNYFEICAKYRLLKK